MKTLSFLLTLFIFSSFPAIGQTNEQKKAALAFVLFKKEQTNVVIIPNTEKYHSFKIFRKLRSDSSYTFVVEKKKPLLPMRYNPTPYGIRWEDKDYHTKDVDYKITAYDKKGNEIGDLTILWDNYAPAKSE